MVLNIHLVLSFQKGGDLSSDPSKHGIIQRSLNNLFRRLKEQDYTDIEVRKMAGFNIICVYIDLRTTHLFLLSTSGQLLIPGNLQ